MGEWISQAGCWGCTTSLRVVLLVPYVIYNLAGKFFTVDSLYFGIHNAHLSNVDWSEKSCGPHQSRENIKNGCNPLERVDSTVGEPEKWFRYQEEKTYSCTE